MSKSLDRIEARLADKESADGLASDEKREGDASENLSEAPFTVDLFDAREFPNLVELQNKLEHGDSDALFELESYRLELDDPMEDLAAASVEVEFEFKRMNINRVVDLTRQAANRARSMGRPAEEAGFRATLARALTLQASGEDINTTTHAAMSYMTGVDLFGSAELEKRNRTIEATYAVADKEMQEAFRLSSASRNLTAMYLVLMSAANIEIHRAMPHRILPHVGQPNTRLPQARRIVMATHETAIRIARLIGKEHLALGYHNYANDLRILGELKRALFHAKKGLVLAKDAGYDYQARLSQRLIELLEADLKGDAADPTEAG
jgi:hypothetical protein